MASFLQNHGDIILDAVLTDYGRKLLAKGDGSFNITKFAFADDEIDYTLFDPLKDSFTNDEKIMETPIMEALTNNAASMKSPLLSLSVDNILFMPTLKHNIYQSVTSSFNDLFTGFVIPIDNTNVSTQITSQYLQAGIGSYLNGVLNVSNREIVVDHGLDSDKLNKNESLRDRYPMMYETQFNVYLDNRFSSLGKNNNNSLTTILPMSIDDDNVAIYKITDQTISNGLGFVRDIQTNDVTPIRGTKGTSVSFTLVPNLDLTATDTLFNKYGKVMNLTGNTDEFYTIRSYVTVEGLNTGCSIEIPVLFAKIKLP